MAKYKVLAPYGLDYPDPEKPGAEKHVDADTVAEDLPESSVPHLLELGWIETVAESPKAGKEN